MKLMRWIAGSVTSVLLVSATTVAEAGEAQHWPLATGYKPEVFHTRNLQQVAKDVAEATQGALQIEVRPNNELVKLSSIPAEVEAGRGVRIVPPEDSGVGARHMQDVADREKGTDGRTVR